MTLDQDWKQIVYETVDDSDEQIMRYLCAMQQQGGNNSQQRRPRRVINRNREDEHLRLMNDYFSENSIYTKTQFRCRYQIRQKLFIRIINALSNHDEYFQMRSDVVGRMCLSPLQKCIAAIRILAYGSHADCVDEYVRIDECTATQCLQKFVRGVNEIFGQEYLKRPNNNDINHLLQIGDA
ncbi:hypothetical protein JHK82_051254 [Glycine max]|uniref:Uncharacterized protein n=1 Tax=Glycine max TaxID=3847 RepID=A0A0R0FBI9_SOYBN|nr:uncharacterized protein LOC100798283 [Glycine max]KAG4922284.1 hypothetical protein JHK86_051097 [Glycine max]KAG5092476.1 hypothetical protein JHK82_051254 [Glycine max]KAG5095550.1 hypothetical protein JHK84_051138 [Glycine max]|eukprot:XP_025982686.1 uncharacterized protein LOC100798283 [Glycine max]